MGTNSRNEVVLEQVNDEQNELGLFGQTEDNFVNWETYRGQTTHKPKLRLCKKADQSGLLQATQPVICENKSLSKRFCDNYNDLPCMMPTSDYMEGAGSCNESIEVFLEAERRDRNEYKSREEKTMWDAKNHILLFAGKVGMFKEVDSFSINQSENLRYLIKSAMLPPVSSRYKVFIVDECQLMQGSTWANLVNVFEQVSRHIINETDIVHRLEKICSEEGFDYDRDALHFIATRSNGTLRDAEMTLEQLTLLGKRITIPLTYEFIGIVSDEELFELLAMALSSDTSNTVKRARELMRSRIDPMQLISQLANLIMDILSGKIQEGASEVKKQFFEQHTCEASKNQTTWLTVALLQLSSAPYFNANDSSLCVRSVQPRGSGASADESLKYLVVSQCGAKITDVESEKLKDKVLLSRYGIELLKSANQGGLAVVELEFRHPKYVSKAEKSWKLIASALQAALGCVPEGTSCLTRMRLNNPENINVGGLGGSHTCLKKEPARTIRNSDGNALSVDFSSQELRKHSSCCYPGSVKHHKKIRSLDTSTNSEVDNNLALSVPRSMSYKTCSCSGDTCVSCGLCKKFTCCSRAERPKKDSKSALLEISHVSIEKDSNYLYFTQLKLKVAIFDLENRLGS
ncbi:STICHEL-like protein 2 isoform X1 [Tanacetum coccineum]